MTEAGEISRSSGMRARICTSLMALALASPASAQMGSAHGLYSGMGEGGYGGMGRLSRSEPPPDLRGTSPYRPDGFLRPASPYSWDPYGRGGYLTGLWTTTSAGARCQLWFDPIRRTYYYYPR